MVRPERFSSGGASTSTGNPGATPAVPEGPAPLYPPLNIPEPYISDKKRAVMNSMLKYKHLIESTRLRYLGSDFKPSGLFQVPDFDPPTLKSFKAKTRIKQITIPLVEKNDETEKNDDTEDEEKVGGASNAKGEEEEEEEAKEEEDEDDDDEEKAVKSDSDIDDYTANAGFDDDEMNFEDAGGEADNDAHTF